MSDIVWKEPLARKSLIFSCAEAIVASQGENHCIFTVSFVFIYNIKEGY